MKELTINEKAQAYDEAFERAMRAHNSAILDKENGVTDKITEHTIQLTETLFPKLKKSEDKQTNLDKVSDLGKQLRFKTLTEFCKELKNRWAKAYREAYTEAKSEKYILPPGYSAELLGRVGTDDKWIDFEAYYCKEIIGYFYVRLNITNSSIGKRISRLIDTSYETFPSTPDAGDLIEMLDSGGENELADLCEEIS